MSNDVYDMVKTQTTLTVLVRPRVDADLMTIRDRSLCLQRPIHDIRADVEPVRCARVFQPRKIEDNIE